LLKLNNIFNKNYSHIGVATADSYFYRGHLRQDMRYFYLKAYFNLNEQELLKKIISFI
jgi:hypothetical protein